MTIVSSSKELPESMVVSPESPDIHSGSADYALRFAGPTGQWMLGVQEQALLQCIAGLSCRSALDIGGGHGQVTIPLARKGLTVRTVVSSTQAAYRLESLLEAEPLAVRERVSIVCGNLIQPPATPGEFDLIVSFRIVSHLDDWQAFLAEMCRLAAQAVLLDYTSQRSLNLFASRLYTLKRNLEGNTRPFHTFADRAIATEVSNHGFTVTRTKRQFFLPMVAHRSLNNERVSRYAEATCGLVGLRTLFGSPVVLCAEKTSD